MDSWVLKRSNRTFRYRDELLDTESEEWISEFGRAKEIAEKYGKILSYNQTLESKLKRQSIKDCKYPYRACTIATNGNVYPCCENNNSPMGNLHDNNFEDIWFGVKYKDLRKSMENKIIPTICRGRLCSYIAGGI
jgi:radical SAM protein with 4Fe4S-binding SPASM domain